MADLPKEGGFRNRGSGTHLHRGLGADNCAVPVPARVIGRITMEGGA
jgi:hypothetical protein